MQRQGIGWKEPCQALQSGFSTELILSVAMMWPRQKKRLLWQMRSVWLGMLNPDLGIRNDEIWELYNCIIHRSKLDLSVGNMLTLWLHQIP
jgi:hypothetical protein